MKIFVILSRVPYPLEKGDKLRAYHQLRELSSRHEIVLCCLSDSPVHPDARQKLGELCSEIHILPLQKWRICLNLLLCIFSRKPFQVMYFYQRKVHRAITALIAASKPDHIYCQLIRTAEYAKDEHGYPKTLDYQDAFSKGMERREEKARWPLKSIFAAERKRLIAYENIIFEYFEYKTIISDEDRRHIYHPERKDIAIITNGIDTVYFTPQAHVAKRCDVLFTGNMSYPPNIETAEYIILEVLPLLKKSKPGITITLAGSAPHRRVKQLENINGVTVTGWVDDIREVYASAKCFFAPMQSGTGLQNKLLEAMSMKLPCVASSLANRPLKAVDSESIIIADTPEGYAAAILSVLNDEKLAGEIGRSGRTFVKMNFSWAESVAQLSLLMQRG